MSSPHSSAASTSPVPSVSPLTPTSAHNVSFANVPQNLGDQFNFDILNNDNNGVSTGVVPAPSTQGGPARRKPSRRANTAERRATHNAVERQRRETLNSRFLDLAALLPNLASVRRPSKSAIVNSSIALIHTQRRARSTAARELRLLKLEADALRAEVNEWRERAGMGLARIDEPLRSRDFEELVSGGLEEAEEALMEEERRALEIAKEGLRLEAAGFGDVLGGNFAYGMYGGLAEEDEEDGSSDSQVGRLRPGSQGSNNSVGAPAPMPISIPRNNSMHAHANPMIFDPSAALLQAHSTQNVGIQNFNAYDLGIQQPLGLHPSAKSNMWAAQQQQQQMYNNAAAYHFQQQQQQNFTSPPPSGNGPASAHYLGNFGLEDDSSATSGSLPDMSGFPIMPQNTRTRSVSSISPLHQLNTKNSASVLAGSLTPPSSAPASATTYAEANPGDVFAAAYRNFPIETRVPGGGNTFHAAMGLFM